MKTALLILFMNSYSDSFQAVEMEESRCVAYAAEINKGKRESAAVFSQPLEAVCIALKEKNIEK